jgi:carboxymethylenebutenolidase
MPPVAVPLADGRTLDAELVLPDGPGHHAGVVVLHESFGLNDDIRRIAWRFADAGYAAIAPDLYSGGNRLICLSRVLRDMVRGTLDAEIAAILQTRDWLAARPEVDGDRLAVAGFCQGGGFALIAGLDEGFKASAVNYGEVPKDRAKLERSCPVVASYGARDKVYGRAAAERLDAHLTELGITHDVKTYENAGHSFFNRHEGWQGWLAKFPTPMHVGYDEDAAEDGWARMLAFFDEHVRGVKPPQPA